MFTRVKGLTLVYLHLTPVVSVARGTGAGETVEAIHTGARVHAGGRRAFIYVYLTIVSWEIGLFNMSDNNV